MKNFHWVLTIRVDGKVVTSNRYRTKKFAKYNMENIISRGLSVYDENRVFPKKFSWSLLKKQGKLPVPKRMIL